MKLYIDHQYRASKKEPFGALLRRLYEGVANSGGPVTYQFVFTDPMVGGRVSSVNRAVKKFPQLASLVRTGGGPLGVGTVAALSGAQQAIIGDETQLPFSVVAEVADGLPRSLPFNAASARISSAAFGVAPTMKGPPQANMDMLLKNAARCGIVASDTWWVNGRNRYLAGSYVVEAPSQGRKIPLPDGPLGEFLAAFGKPKSAVQYPITEGPEGDRIVLKGKAESPPELKELGERIIARLPELIAAAGMPHEISSSQAPHAASPLKPALEKHFKPLGYSCKGGSGTFSLRRRTAGNHVVEVDMDVGTWSRNLTAFFRVYVPNFQLRLPMPVSPQLQAMQCSIGDAERWEKMVENMAAFTAHLDREVVPEVAKVAGPAPEWFDAPSHG